MKKLGFHVLVVAGITLSFAVPGLGQTTGRLRGSVVDPEGAAIPGATITIRSEVLMGGSRVSVTGSSGAYSFRALPPGPYSATAELEGFESAIHEGVQVAINATATANFVLHHSEFADEITVTGEAPLVDVTSSSLATNFGSKSLQDLPTHRNFTDPMAVAPGITFALEGGRPFHLSAFGSDISSNSWSVDGIGVSAPYTGSSLILFNAAIVEETQVMGVGAPAEFGNLQGAALNVVTKSGSNRLKASLNAYWSIDALQGDYERFDESEDTEEEEDFEEEEDSSHSFLDLNASLGGPIQRDRLWFFVAYEKREEAFDGYDMKLSSRINDRNLLDLRVGLQNAEYSWNQDEFTEPSAAVEESLDSTYWTLDYQSLFSDRTYLEARYAGWENENSHLSPTGSREPAYIDLSPPGGGPTRYSGGMWWPFRGDMSSEQAGVTLSHFADDYLGGNHDLKFGVQINQGESTSRSTPSATGSYYFHIARYGQDYYYRVEGSPSFSGTEQETWGVFVDDSWAVTDRLTMNLGLRFDRAKAIIPAYPILNPDGSPTGQEAPSLDPAFTWNNWSPRVGFAYNAGASRRTVLRGAFGVYYDGVHGGAFGYPPPYTPTMFFSTGPSWSGPWSHQGIWSEETLTASIDPELRAPRTLQVSLGIEREFLGVYSLGATVVFKDSKDGVGWEILDDGAYETFEWTDPFNGRTYTLLDPQEFPTVRKGNGPGFTVEGRLDNYWAKYEGLILTFNRRFADWWGLQASYTFSDSEGIATWPLSGVQWSGTGASKNGSHPNQWLNLADGQQQLADRPDMFRVLANWQLPWNLHASTVVKLQSGRPYSRQARADYEVISIQQSNFIADQAGGPNRFDFQNLINFAIGKRWQLPGRFTLKTDLQVFNLLSSDAVDDFQTYVLDEGDEFIPSAWVEPFSVELRIGLVY